MLNRLKVINGYSADARWFAETGDAIGEIPTILKPAYGYSPTQTVWPWNGKNVIHVETRHRRYEVFEVPENIEILPYK